MKYRAAAILLAICFLLAGFPAAHAAQGEDIIILYESDVHCAVDGYAKLAALKQELSGGGAHVGVVSSGDFIQGGSLGASSQGEYIVNIMNLVGYDAVTLGNHEFDYKLPRLFELTEMMDTKPVCSNFKETDEDEPVFEPFCMVRYGQVDIAYIGITTPDTLTSAAPAQFVGEDGEYAYTFCGDVLYDTVQNSIDAALQQGAEYVIALSHLGTENVQPQWSAQELVRNTSGLDAVLDGHSHSVVEQMAVKDMNGDEVIITSTGTKFEYIGKLTIAGGEITAGLIDAAGYEKTDETVTAYIERINGEYQQLGSRVIGRCEVPLATMDEAGNRLIRHTQTNMGDFCSDAFRIVTGADIAMVNGGGIRADIAAGEITFNDILNVFPWNNRVIVARVTGQQIADMLELGVMNYPQEDGSFQHVSGITFEIDRAIPSSVVLDENMMFKSVDGERRVKNIKVLDAAVGEYAPIDLNKTYTLASHNHLLLDLGGGAAMFKDAEIISDSGMLDVELLETYITLHLGGIVGSEYTKAQGRISTAGSAQPQEELPPKTADESTLLTWIALACAALGGMTVILRRMAAKPFIK